MATSLDLGKDEARRKRRGQEKSKKPHSHQKKIQKESKDGIFE